VLLAIELLDELGGATYAAAWPLIRDDLGLSYAEVGIVLAVPGFVGSALDPLIGAAADTVRRRALLLIGGFGFALSAALASVSIGLWTLLIALLIGNPSTGAFVSLAQATLMDLAPERRERNMAWWTLAGSLGYVGGPVVLTVALWIGVGWRGTLAGLALMALSLTLAVRRLPSVFHRDGGSLVQSLVAAQRALRRREVLRWLALLEVADLLLDVLFYFLALYLVDVAGWSVVEAALGVAVWTGAGLVGDAFLIPVLKFVRGTTYLRASALGALVCYPLFLVAPGHWPKLAVLAALGLLNSGWYAIPKAGLYGALPGRSGAAIALGGISGFIGASVPLAIGIAAEIAGLGATMWALLVAPLILLALTPRR
jgi:FSR family fosmidomycin resistance protein-like MFS transporter